MSVGQKLMEVLNRDGRELLDIKFIPGSSRSLSAADMADEAAKVAEQLFDETIPHSPPVTGLFKKVF